MITLSERELRLVKILISFIVILLIYFLIISPVISYKNNLEKTYANNISKLNSLDSIYEKYLEVKQEKNKLQNLLRSSRGVTSLIETYARETNILNNKVYTRDHPSNIQNKYKKITTDVKFESVDITSIMKFIYKLENSNKLIKISYLRIQQAIKGKDTYDVTLKIDSYTML